MRAYIQCPRRKNKPKVAVEVCRKCRHNKTCTTFQEYQNPPLFSDIKHGYPRGWNP